MFRYGKPDNEEINCYDCWCSGRSKTCSMAENLYRYEHRINFDCKYPEEDFGIFIKTEQGRRRVGNVKNTKEGPQLRYLPTRQEKDQVLYWSVPLTAFHQANPEKPEVDPVTLYGGTVGFKMLFLTHDITEEASPNMPPSVLMYDQHGKAIAAKTQQPLLPNRRCQIHKFKIQEGVWRNPNTGVLASRADILEILTNFDRFEVLSAYSEDVKLVGLHAIKLRPASENLEFVGNEMYDDLKAYKIEKCQCPTGYAGYSCEKCAEGYRKNYKNECVSIYNCTTDCQLPPVVEHKSCRKNQGYLPAKSCDTFAPEVDPERLKARVAIQGPTNLVIELGSDIDVGCRVELIGQKILKKNEG